MAHRRLLVHAHVPRAGGGQLNRRLLFRCHARPDTLLVYGERHARQAHADAEGAAAARIAGRRFAAGTVPYGYFDGLGAWTTYVSVFCEPVERFVRFLDLMLSVPSEALEALTGGQGPSSRLGRDDPDRFALELLERPEVRRRQVDVMTRVAAGQPLHAERETDPGLLAAARANLARTNYIVGLRDHLADFAEELQAVLGLSPAADEPSALGWDAALAAVPAVEPALVRADLRPSTLDAIAAANAADLRLYDSVATRRHADRRACGF